MKTIKKAGLGGVAILALIFGAVTPAHADPAPGANDIVGVGSDTVEFLQDFLADGDVTGDTGFNNANATRRVINFDATGDGFAGATTNAGVVLRANSKPVVRPNGSGPGITALLTDTGPTEVINYVRSSRLPTAGEQGTATSNGWHGLHVYQVATDGLKIAVSKAATNAPAALSPATLVGIYQGSIKTWGDVPGYAGPAPTGVIHPVIPQSGSGTRNFFLADLQAANGGTAITLGSNVEVVQEHDPAPIQGNPNAIGPFSVGRITLLNSGYFGSGVQNVVAPLTGTSSYTSTRGLYILVRQSDVTSTTPWQVGSTRNWVQTLFAGPTSWAGRSANASLIAAAGVTPAYSDLGVVSG